MARQVPRRDHRDDGCLFFAAALLALVPLGLLRAIGRSGSRRRERNR